MAMQRMQKAEEQLWQMENNAKHTLPTLHGELNELRRALKLQEDVQARTLSELEAARNAHQGFRQPSSSIPISSRTTESGWECVSRDRVQAFPVGVEIRSLRYTRLATEVRSIVKGSTSWGVPSTQQKEQRLSTLCLVLIAKHPSASRSVRHHHLPLRKRVLPRLRKTQKRFVIDNFGTYS